MRTQPVNRDHHQGEEDLAAQLFDAPDILECLYKFLHGDIKV